MSARVVALDSTPDSRRVPLCVHDYRAFRTVQEASTPGSVVVELAH